MTERQSLLPDDVKPATVLAAGPVLLSEITDAVCAHYGLSVEELVSLYKHQARGLLVVLARRYARGVTTKTIGEWLGCTNGTVGANYTKTHGRLAVDELLRDDLDIIERRLADIVIERSRGMPSC